MEIAVEVVRMVLEYFGWEGHEIEALLSQDRRSRRRRSSIVRRIGRELLRYNFKLFTKRSIVREIGSRLPLKPCKRPYFELSINRDEQEFCEGVEGKPLSQMLMASLADVAWITDDDHSLPEPDLPDDEEEVILTKDANLEIEMATISIHDQPAHDVKDNLPNDEAMQKISALEDELQNLRAQIAMMLISAPPNQVMPSTPVGATAPPAPPPPPPPPPTPMSTPLKPVSQIIRENRAKRLSLAPGLAASEQSNGCSLPNMTEVLKGLGKVKLRSVERSPGGTPLRKPPVSTEGSDPASIIAQALKKKFAHRRRHEANSPDANKENNSPGSPFGTPPTSPNKSVPFGPHLLKATKKKRRSSTGLTRTRKPSPLVEVC